MIDTQSKISESAKFLLFTLDSLNYALPIGIVQRVIRAVEIIPLPKAPTIFLGVVNIQGEFTAVINIRKRFNHKEKNIDLNDQIILIKIANRTIVILADNCRGIIEIPERLIIEANKVVPGSGYVEGIAKAPDGTILILNLEKILSLEEEEFLKEIKTIHKGVRNN